MGMVEMGQFDINLIGEQAQELLLKPFFLDSEIESIFDVKVLVNKAQKIGYVSGFENFLREAGGCGFNPSGKFSIFDRTLDTTQVKGEDELCVDEFKDTLYKQLLKKGTAQGDAQGTLLMNLLIRRALQAIKKDTLRLAFFGDKTSGDVNNNFVDGMWTVYIPQLVAANLIPYIDSLSGTPLVAGDGIDLLQAVWEGANPVLKAVPMNRKIMMVSHNVYEQLMADYENQGVSSTLHLEILENGRDMLKYRGIEVRPFYEWQRYAEDIQSVADANYVLYTERSNLVLGTDISNPLNQFESWYDKREQSVAMRTQFYLGFNYKHEELMAVAY